MTICQLQLSPFNLVLAASLLFFILIIYRWHTSKNSFSVVDLFINWQTGKADLFKTIVLFFTLLSGWVVVIYANDEKKDVTPLLLGVLGIFITQFVAKSGIDAYKEVKKNGSSETTVETVATTITETKETKGGKDKESGNGKRK